LNEIDRNIIVKKTFTSMNSII